MKKTSFIITGTVFCFIGFFGGTYYGFKEGFTSFSLLDQVTQGALSRHQLASIEKNKIDSVIHLFELNIDAGLHRYVVYQKYGNKILSNHFLPEMTSEIENYVDLMAEYRKEHPMVFNLSWAEPAELDDQRTTKWKEQELKDSEKMFSEIKQLLKSRGVPEQALTNSSN